MTPSKLDEILGGKNRTPSAVILRFVLWTAQLPYFVVTSIRNCLYDFKWKKIHRVDAPVVSVGNITTGGTGKTPLVAWLAGWCRSRGIRVSIASRGYGSSEGQHNDEALELEARLPDVPHMQDRDRVQVANQLVEELESELILLDDGFQHRRLHRDLDIVLIDCTKPFGYGHVLPRGLLRESLAQLRRADVVCMTRADCVSDAQRSNIRRRLEAYAPEAVIATVTHSPECLVACNAEQVPIVEHSLDELRQKPIAGICGIGNPNGFRHTLEECDFQVADFREFPDHHPFPREDVESLIRWADESEAEAIVCTVKDLVKLGVQRLGTKPLFAVRIGVQFTSGQSEFSHCLEQLVGLANIRS